MKAIILAGGTGTRLWPLSRSQYPKQFLKLKEKEKSIFQLTVERCLKLCSIEEIYIVTNKEYKFLVYGQIEELKQPVIQDNILLEPQSKNTLPAVYYGVKTIHDKEPDVIVVMSSDHLIGDEKGFIDQLKLGIKFAKTFLLTFGMKPIYPETGYGYIKPSREEGSVYIVDEFVEKPDYEYAKKYVEEGYYWNSGMFMFSSELLLEEAKRLAPEIYNAFERDMIQEAYQDSPNISIDYGLIEKSNKVAVLPMEVEWNDLGSFVTFYDEYKVKTDDSGNVIFNDEIVIDSRNSLVYSDSEKMIALLGVDDLVVIDQKDALLICDKEKTQDVKKIVDILHKRKDPRVESHLIEYRPWGSFTILENGIYYKIKRLTVLPGKQLSYQMHHHRSEHWIVVNGTATVIINDNETHVCPGESTYISSGYKHRLANNGKLLLEVIEVQIGSYLGEDDIIRFLDDFGR